VDRARDGARRERAAVADDLEAGGDGQDGTHGATDMDRDAARLRGALERRRDRAHAADRVTPHARLAERVAERVMQQQVAAACVVWAREMADDRVEAEPALQEIRFEPTVEPVSGAAGDELPECRERA